MVSVQNGCITIANSSFCYLNKNGFLFFYRTQQIEHPAFHQIRARYPELAVLSAYLAYFLKGEEHNG